MAIALVNTAAFDAAGPSATIASPAQSHTTGNLLVAMVRWGSNLGSVSSVSDTAGNSYFQCTGAAGNDGSLSSLDIWYANAITGNAANIVTAHLSGGFSTLAIIVHQYSGQSMGTVFETAKYASAASATSVTSPSFSTAASGNVNVAMGSQTVSATNSWSAGTNYTLEANSGTNTNAESEDRLNAPSGAQTASISWTGTANLLSLAVASFKAPVSGGTSQTAWVNRHRKFINKRG